jgi:hypothetical protein
MHGWIIPQQDGRCTENREEEGNAMFAILDPDEVELGLSLEVTDEWDRVMKVMGRLVKHRSTSMPADQARPDGVLALTHGIDPSRVVQLLGGGERRGRTLGRRVVSPTQPPHEPHIRPDSASSADPVRARF